MEIRDRLKVARRTHHKKRPIDHQSSKFDLYKYKHIKLQWLLLLDAKERMILASEKHVITENRQVSSFSQD